MPRKFEICHQFGWIPRTAEYGIVSSNWNKGGIEWFDNKDDGALVICKMAMTMKNTPTSVSPCLAVRLEDGEWPGRKSREPNNYLSWKISRWSWKNHKIVHEFLQSFAQTYLREVRGVLPTAIWDIPVSSPFRQNQHDRSFYIYHWEMQQQNITFSNDILAFLGRIFFEDLKWTLLESSLKYVPRGKTIKKKEWIERPLPRGY